jgi:hypothetical protein
MASFLTITASYFLLRHGNFKATAFAIPYSSLISLIDYISVQFFKGLNTFTSNKKMDRRI